MTAPTLSTPSAGREGASIDRAPRAHRKGPLAELLASLGYRGSRSVATQANRLDALRVELEDVVEAAVEAGLDGELDGFLGRVDEMRVAGVRLSAGTAEIVAIEAADAADNAPRMKYWLTRCRLDAQPAVLSMRRTVRALLEGIRVIRTEHPGVR